MFLRYHIQDTVEALLVELNLSLQSYTDIGVVHHSSDLASHHPTNKNPIHSLYWTEDIKYREMAVLKVEIDIISTVEFEPSNI